jgi:Flp pilus assembly pilin Flp
MYSIQSNNFKGRARRSGQTLVEYALIIAFIAVAAIAALIALGGQTSSTMAGVGTQLGKAQLGGVGGTAH